MFSRSDMDQSRKAGQTSSSWPRASQWQQNQATDDEYIPLLDAFYTSRKQKSSRPSKHTLTAPLPCRMQAQARYPTLFLAIIFFMSIMTTVSAIPLRNAHSIQLAKRQSIPDAFGNTGNEPAIGGSFSRAGTLIVVAPTSTGVPAATISSVQSPDPTGSFVQSASAEPTSESTPESSTTVSNTPTTRPEEQFQRTSPVSPFTPGLIAGIVGGGVAVLATVAGVLFLIIRRRRQPEIQEIPIRRSRLGSRLGFRMFGNKGDNSRSPSAASGKYTGGSSRRVSKEFEASRLTLAVPARTSTFGPVGSWLDKRTIGRPKPNYVDTSSKFLELPRPLFADRDRVVRSDDKAPWQAPKPNNEAKPF